MKRLGKLILIVIIGLTFFLPQMTVAQGRNVSLGNGGKNCWRQGSTGTGWTLRDEMDSIRLEVLFELTKFPIDSIKKDLQSKPLWFVLNEYKVDRKLFQPKMHKKAMLLIKNAARDGKISQGQKNRLLERMRQGRGKNQFGRTQGQGCGRGRGRGWNRNCRWN